MPPGPSICGAAGRGRGRAAVACHASPRGATTRQGSGHQEHAPPPPAQPPTCCSSTYSNGASMGSCPAAPPRPAPSPGASSCSPSLPEPPPSAELARPEAPALPARPCIQRSGGWRSAGRGGWGVGDVAGLRPWQPTRVVGAAASSSDPAARCCFCARFQRRYSFLALVLRAWPSLRFQPFASPAGAAWLLLLAPPPASGVACLLRKALQAPAAALAAGEAPGGGPSPAPSPSTVCC